MVSNLRISVAELVVWALLAAAGLTWISFRVVDGAAWLMDWLRDRVTPLLEDDRPEGVLCAGCAGFDHCDGVEGGCDCTCGWPEDWAELPPERTWEQMTSHQLPLVEIAEQNPRWVAAGRPMLAAERERRAPWWEAEQRQAYAALDLEFPSGLLARVREAAP